MGIQEPEFELHEIQQYFEREIRHVRIISDLELSEDEYRRLGIKLKSLFAFANNSNFADDFMLCLVIYWTYNHIYRDERNRKLNSELIHSFQEMSQYTQRHYLNMFLECFHDFGLNSYQIASGSVVKDCELLSARHAGIPYDEQMIVLELASQYLPFKPDAILDTVQSLLPGKTRRIINFMDRQMQCEVVEELQKLLISLETTDVTQEGLLQAFPALSRHLIMNAVQWHENQRLKILVVEF